MGIARRVLRRLQDLDDWSGTPADATLVTFDNATGKFKPATTLDTDGTLAANSDTRVASQKAVRTFVNAYGGHLPARGAICFGWDDGYASAYSKVYPAARARGQRHTFYIITSRIGTAGYVTSAQIAEMFAGGMEIGSHTVNHLTMATLTSAQRQPEWDDSKTAIEAIIGAGNCNHFAYPSGSRNATTDSEAYLRYRTVRLVQGSVGSSRSVLQTISRPAYAIHGFSWSNSSHAALLEMIKYVARVPVVLTVFGHDVDNDGGPGGAAPTSAQLAEGLDLAQSLGVPCVSMEQAFGGLNISPVDGGFEDGGLGWQTSLSTGGSFAVVTDTPDVGLSGTKSAKLTCNGASASSPLLQSGAPLFSPGQIHTLSFRYRVVIRGGTGSINARGYSLDYLDASSGVVTSAALASTTWLQASVDFTASTTAKYLGVEFQISNTLDADLYVDHVHIGPKAQGILG